VCEGVEFFGAHRGEDSREIKLGQEPRN
jgi:hypothetical protein